MFVVFEDVIWVVSFVGEFDRFWFFFVVFGRWLFGFFFLRVV